MKLKIFCRTSVHYYFQFPYFYFLEYIFVDFFIGDVFVMKQLDFFFQKLSNRKRMWTVEYVLEMIYRV
jgi:hypothetical protein